MLGDDTLPASKASAKNSDPVNADEALPPPPKDAKVEPIRYKSPPVEAGRAPPMQKELGPPLPAPESVMCLD